ncbi:hypothetical protein [Lactococcus protaetiae]|uniref:Uncharacterized protein n=1 Tax=Lactococcus protaetiae TaxID=2592653 RepID=A0A514Z6E6_9LACT|nr:hypothetical protein [Lactococcus protaetiae]QDK70175.1 hypothetical protein FLP15_02000 [Lactococcus protaetiae]
MGKIAKEEREVLARSVKNLSQCQRNLEELQLRIQDDNEISESFKNNVSTGLLIVHLVQVTILDEYAVDFPKLSAFLKDNSNNL